MLSNIKKNMENDFDTVINSNKNTLVNLIFVDDISKIVEISILKENIRGNIIVFNKNGIITLDNLTHKIAKILDYKKQILFKEDRQLIESNIMKPDLSTFNDFFNHFEFTDLEKGLEITTNFLSSC
jgi:nucleoside-diphosphate-sugar epimerase